MGKRWTPDAVEEALRSGKEMKFRDTIRLLDEFGFVQVDAKGRGASKGAHIKYQGADGRVLVMSEHSEWHSARAALKACKDMFVSAAEGRAPQMVVIAGRAKVRTDDRYVPAYA